MTTPRQVWSECNASLCILPYSLLGKPSCRFPQFKYERGRVPSLEDHPLVQGGYSGNFWGDLVCWGGGKDNIFQLLTGQGYTHFDTIARDDIFVKLDPKDITT